MATAPTKTLKIDGDSHFFPPVDFTDVAERVGMSDQAVEMILRDITTFTDREARRGGFKSSAAGKRTAAVNPTAATTQAGGGPIGHGVAEHRVKLLPETGFDMQVLIPDGAFANAFGSPIARDKGEGLHLALSMSYNNAAAAAQNEYPDQLIACGVLPFGAESVEACIARSADQSAGCFPHRP